MARTLPARYPPHGAWPALLRADSAAAYFDCSDTKEFFRRVAAGEAPRPCDMIGKGAKREPIWTVDSCRSFIRARFEHDAPRALKAEDVAELI